MTQKKHKTIVIGAGLAGAAAAFGLVRRGADGIIVLEQEKIPGYYASGRNAAMVRQLGSNREAQRLVRLGLSFYDSPPAPFPGPVRLHRVGSYLLASGKELDALRSWIKADATLAASIRFSKRAEVEEMFGPARPANFEEAVHTSTDGVADVHALLNGLLQGVRNAGGEVRYSTRATEISRRGDRVAALRTDAGEVFECSTVINAAGPWAGRVGELAGAAPIPFLTYRRHLAQTGPASSVNPEWPFVWNLSREVYFRPESGGVLLSPCDEGIIEPCDPKVDPAAMDLLTHKVADCFPGFSDLQLHRSWACIRTFVADRRIVIGADPALRGFYWAAALGGNGVGLAPMLSYLMADLVLDGRSSLLSDEELQSVSPARFAT